MITLRQDQAKAMGELRAALKGHQAVLLQAACGFGKTVVAAEISAGAQRKKKRVIIGVHRRELAKQTAVTCERFGISYGYIMAGATSDPFATVQIASANTVAKRPGALACDLFIPDEAHLWASDARAGVLDRAKQAGAMLVGLSATPERLDGRALGNTFDVMVCGPPVRWLIDQGHLSDYRAFAPVQPNLKTLKVRGGEYATGDLEANFDKPAVVGDAVKHYRRFADGLRTIAFAFSRSHGRHLCDAYNAAGIGAVYIDGDTSPDERFRAIMKIANGQAYILVNVALCIEGFDLSAQVGRDVPIEAVSLQRPTKSLPLAIQMVMRCMRKKERPGVIMDHVNLLRDHGLPDDDREWSLDGRPVKAKDGEPIITTRICTSCFFTGRPFVVCPSCGQQIAPTEGRQVDEVDGDLAELDREAFRRDRERDIRSARTLDDLAKVAVAYGYRAGWIRNLMKNRGDGEPDWRDIDVAMSKARRAAQQRAAA